jgi:pimeloyl-ACP methyl ester carboxylesterase
VVVVLHGGPGAVGEAAPLARGLADSFRVLEPWQRGSGDAPLSVARHIADLQELLEAHSGDARPALVGESWGAMLALAHAAAHPSSVGPIVLVGCGTFDPVGRARMRAILEERMDDELRRRLERLPEKYPDPDERLRKRYELTKTLYSVDPILASQGEEDNGSFDVRAHTETWEDMLRLQDEGVYPASFAVIKSPVLMLHGAYDPHPGRMIQASLEPYLPQLEYREWEHCGHSPWFEGGVRDEFFAVMRHWLARHLVGAG